ncbi:MAG: SEL1-like repeat protein [Aequorivita sp.]|nr:SEL1-like repeat protein [Aequorivita sp.]
MDKKILLLLFCATLSFSAYTQNYQDVVLEAKTEKELDDVCKTAMLGFMSTPRDIEDAVNGILKTVGIKNIKDAAFVLKECDQINNAVAKNIKDDNGNDVRYVLYDPNLLQNVVDKTNDTWAAKFILAHEIGHHMLGHSLNNGKSNHKYELDADFWAGRALGMMGATEEETLSATNILPENASSSHPARADRRAKAREGWNSEERTKIIKVRDEDINEIAKTIVSDVNTNLKEKASYMTQEDFSKNLKALNYARTEYYKGYTEDIRYLEAICLTGMNKNEEAINAYINYLSIENLDNKSRVKQIVSFYVASNTNKSSFFQNPDVIYQICKEYFDTEKYEEAINYGQQFQQFSNSEKDKERISEINQIIGRSEYNRIMMDDGANLERGYQAFKNQDYSKAFELLSKGVESNDDKSELMVGQMYFYGWGTTKNTDKAFELLLKSCQKGNADAQYIVGTMYNDGISASRDTEKAKYWWGKASSQGHTQATSNLDALNREIAKREAENNKPIIEEKKVEREETDAEKMAMNITNGDSYFNNGMYADAYENFILAARKGNAYAQEKVAWMLYKGKGISKNKNEGIEWWRKAAKQGNVDAINILTRLGEW